MYKEMDAFEKISFEQCTRVLSNHPIVIVSPEGLLVQKMVHLPEREGIQFAFFNEKYFTSILSYSALLTSCCFYERFVEYKYILIHQLDSFVFRDELTEWCSKGIDYVGAPWIGTRWQTTAEFQRDTAAWFPIWLRRIRPARDRWFRRYGLVGNGGFSLRRVRSTLIALSLLRAKAEEWKSHEDMFFSYVVPAYLPFFRIPRVDEALKFSFETSPRVCFERNGGALPFGCHGWWKSDPSFWRPFLRDQGYEF
jgi:hypothetical protein